MTNDQTGKSQTTRPSLRDWANLWGMGEAVTALEQAIDRMEQVEAFKRGEAHCLPQCEAAIEHAKAVLEGDWKSA